MTVSKSVKIIRSIDEQIVDATLSQVSTKNLDDFELAWKPQLTVVIEEGLTDSLSPEELTILISETHDYIRERVDRLQLDRSRV